MIVLFISEYHVLFNPSSALLERFIIICDYDSMPYFENIAKTITRPKHDHLTANVQIVIYNVSAKWHHRIVSYVYVRVSVRCYCLSHNFI